MRLFPSFFNYPWCPSQLMLHIYLRVQELHILVLDVLDARVVECDVLGLEPLTGGVVDVELEILLTVAKFCQILETSK